MAYFRKNSTPGTPFNGPLEIVEGKSVTLKIYGLAPSKQHFVVRSCNPNIVKVAVLANNKNVEQTVTITGLLKNSTTVLHGYDPAYINIPSGKLNKIVVHIHAKIALPTDLTSEQMIMLEMLLAESVGPGVKSYREDLALQAMQWMRYTFINRVELSRKKNLPANQLSVPENNRTITGAITYSNVIAGFEKYPKLPVSLRRLIDSHISKANHSEQPHFFAYRRMIDNAVAVATGQLPGIDHPSKVYAWRTKGQKVPSGNFEKITTLQGQDFYTLKKGVYN